MATKLKRPMSFLLALVVAMVFHFPIGVTSGIKGIFNFGLPAKAAAETITPTKPTKGDGSSGSPYEIGTKEELYWFAALVNGKLTDGTQQNKAACAKLTADITVNGKESPLLKSLEFNEKTGEVTNGENFTAWTPIGYYNSFSDQCTYTGIFDGAGHTISGLYFNDTNIDYVGLFGYNSGTIQNVGVVDSYFNGKERVGGVCGDNRGTIKNCYNTGTVKGSGNSVGGVCGSQSGYKKEITNCYNTGTVSGNEYVGGVCGSNDSNANIKNCYNTGTVSGNSDVGGVCGYNSGNITNCYYLDGTAKAGIGYNSGGTLNKVESKTTKQFGSGEVAFLLQDGQTAVNDAIPEVWGQTLTGDNKQDYPVLGGAKVYPSTPCTAQYSNTDGATLDHKFVSDNNGFKRCEYCGEESYDAAVLVDGVYEISNKNQLYWFASLVNGTLIDGTPQDTTACAKLTANITVNSGVLNTDGELNNDKVSDFISWTPIGNESKPYTGTFDGNGKTISGLYFSNSSTDNVGLFGRSTGTIKNVGVVDSYFCGKEKVGGVCGTNDGNITNCYNTSKVSGSYVGGVCGYNNQTIKNCYNTGKVSGSFRFGGVCGWKNNGTITNCYYLDSTANGGIDSADKAGAAEFKTKEQFNSGEVAYLLQSGQTAVDGKIPEVWGQTLTGENKQDYPVLGGTKVYQSAPCTGKYSNTVGATLVHHSVPDNNGFERCEYCGEESYVAADSVDGVYQIGNVGQLYWFADKVNNEYDNYKNAQAILTADIIVNTGVLTATGALASDTRGFRSWTPIGNDSKPYTGTFDGNSHTISGLYFNDNSTDYVGLFGYNSGTIKNVGVVDSYFYGKNNVGGVCGRNGEKCTIQNCYNTCSVNGKDYVGGVCGVNAMYGTIQNCYNTGNVDSTDAEAPCVGDVCGGSHALGYIKNCYYLAGTATSDSYATIKTAAQFGSGEVAYLLRTGTGGDVWGQTLTGDNKQNYPILGGEKVYQSTPCTTQYSNSDNIKLEHPELNTYINGFGTCTNCGKEAYQPANLVGDVYQISNVGQLYWFAQQVNIGNTGINAELTANITVNSNLLTSLDIAEGVVTNGGKFRSWTPIGNESNQYNGTFNGNGKTVSGLYFNDKNTDYVGLFGYNKGTIKNVGVVDSYFYGNNNVGGACGRNVENGTIENCYNTGKVYSNVSDVYVGGVCGAKINGTITNCYYLAGTATRGIGRCDDKSGEVESKTTDEFGSGEVCYLLNGSKSDGENLVWGQTLGADGNAYPVFHNNTNTVYYGYVDCTAKDKTYSNDKPHEEQGHKFDSANNYVCLHCRSPFATLKADYAPIETAVDTAREVAADGTIGEEVAVNVAEKSNVITCAIALNGSEPAVDSYELKIFKKDDKETPLAETGKSKHKKILSGDTIAISIIQIVYDLENNTEYTVELTLYDGAGNKICTQETDYPQSQSE